MCIYKLLNDTFFVLSPVLRNYTHGSLSLRPNIVVGKDDSLDHLGLVVLLEGKSFSVIMLKVFCKLIQRKSVSIPRLYKSGDGHLILVVQALVVFWVLINILFLFILIIIEDFASFSLLFFLYLDKRKFNFSLFLLVVFIWDAVTLQM